jgi:hypothetical protein
MVSPGPSEYRPQNQFEDNLRKRSCYTIHKPEIIDEKFYDFVGGMSKVLRTELMPPNLLKKFEDASTTFCKSRTDLYPLEIIKPERING